MALQHYGNIFNIDQCKLYPLTVDNATTLTYGASIACPGIQSIELNPDVLYKELYGDGAILAVGSKVRKGVAAVNYAQLSLDAISVISGSASVVDSGTTPSQTAVLTELGTDIPGYFKIEFRVLQIDIGAAAAGSFNVVLHKCKLQDFKPGVGVMEDYGIQQFTAAYLRTNKDGKLATLTFNETAASLS